MLPRIEACLNYRLLCPTEDNPSDINPLTPDNFLAESAPFTPEPDFSMKSLNYANRHHLFARRWNDEYLVELHKCNKFKYPQRDFAIDDSVVIRHDNLTPNE